MDQQAKKQRKNPIQEKWEQKIHAPTLLSILSQAFCNFRIEDQQRRSRENRCNWFESRIGEV